MAQRRSNTKSKMNNSRGKTPGSSAIGLARRNQPRTANTSNSIRHKGRERMLAVAADDNGDNTYVRRINPGLESTYSVGNRIAQGFECWSVPPGAVNSIEFISSSPATARGRIIMFANYDASDNVPMVEDDFADRADAVACSVWENKTLRLRGPEMVCPGAHKPVRVYDTTQDRLLTDGCTLHIGIFGADPGPAGSVYINYDYMLHVQRPFTGAIPAPLHKTFLIGTSTSALPNTEADFLGLTRSFDGIGIFEDSGTFTLNRGYYELSYGFDFLSLVTSAFEVSVLAKLDGVGIPQSRVNYASEHSAVESFGLTHPGVIFFVPTGGVLTFAFSHSHSSTLSLVGARSRATLTRL